LIFVSKAIGPAHGSGEGGLRMDDETRANRCGARTAVATEPLERLVLAAHPGYVRRAINLVVAVDITLLLAYVGSTLLGYDIGLLKLDHELNIPTWYASAKLLAIAALLALVALMFGTRDRIAPIVLLMPVALFVFLSMDETASVHERLGFRIDSILTDTPERDEMVFGATGYWMFVLGPMLAAAMVAMGMAYRRLMRPAGSTMRLAALGAGVLLFGATVVEIASNFVEHPFASMFQVALEEGMELIGATLILAAAMHLTAQKLRQSAPQPLPRQFAAPARAGPRL
jgi:hypothetical protein